MNNYDMDALMSTYADWITYLKEKEASLEGQLARMKGKEKASAPTKAAEPSTDEVEPITVAPETPEVIPTEAETESPVAKTAPVETSAEDAEEDDWL